MRAQVVCVVFKILPIPRTKLLLFSDIYKYITFFILYFSWKLRTIHAQYTDNTRTIHALFLPLPRGSSSIWILFEYSLPSRHLSSLAVPPASVSRIPTTRLVLGGVPDNARVIGCTCVSSPSKYSSTTLDGVPSRVSRLPKP